MLKRLLLLPLLMISLVQAQTLINPAYLEGETYAVVVGISDYHADPLDLSVSAEDGRAFADWLAQGGFPPVSEEKMIMLLDHDATLINIELALNWMASQAGAKDRIVFFFSGHGAPSGLAPTDFRLQDGSNLLTHSSIKTILKKSQSTQVLLIIDACHAQGSEAAIYFGAVSDLLHGYANSGISMLLSSDITQSSFEFKEVGLSFFTHYLLQGMRQGYANQDNNRIITIMEAYQYVRLNVEVMTGGEQIPQIGGDFDPDIVMKFW